MRESDRARLLRESDRARLLRESDRARLLRESDRARLLRESDRAGALARVGASKRLYSRSRLFGNCFGNSSAGRPAVVTALGRDWPASAGSSKGLTEIIAAIS
ncbi:hypothetical protein J25TS5_47400 [Paenibacillus faecis]|nr:hypothetical protein J25TS5_47400 [Paenibacillus faecis]